MAAMLVVLFAYVNKCTSVWDGASAVDDQRRDHVVSWRGATVKQCCGLTVTVIVWALHPRSAGT